jgi:hypothetical protein
MRGSSKARNTKNRKKNNKRKTPPSTPAIINDDLVFLNLTCTREQEEHYFDTDEFPSTHDAAEMMLYAYVDDSPSVADLLWTKKQQGQDQFLTLTDEQEWAELPLFNYSTHDPSYK